MGGAAGVCADLTALADFATVSDLTCIRAGDLAQISRPLDAIGINYYRRYHVRHTPGASAQPP